MTITYVAATSPRGEVRFWKFYDEVAARCFELGLYMQGWQTRPILTLHDDAPLSERDALPQVRPEGRTPGDVDLKAHVPLAERCPYCGDPGCTAHDVVRALDPLARVRCAVCDDHGCEFCPKASA